MDYRQSRKAKSVNIYIYIYIFHTHVTPGDLSCVHMVEATGTIPARYSSNQGHN